MNWIYGIEKINLEIRYMELELKNPWIECMNRKNNSKIGHMELEENKSREQMYGS
jgi:hypothetical protein